MARTGAELSRHRRKTRLSFKLDPSLVMGDVMEGVMCHDESKDTSLVTSCEMLNRCDDPKMDLLAKLLNM